MKILPLNFALNQDFSFGKSKKAKLAERQWQTDYIETIAKNGLCESPEDSFFRRQSEDEFFELVGSSLSKRERDVISRRYGFDGFEPKPLKKVAKELKVSEGVVKRREESALKKLGNVLAPYYA